MLQIGDVLKSYDGKHVAVDTTCRTYTGRLQWNGDVACVQEADGTIAWINVTSVTGVRVYPAGPRPPWVTGAA